MWQLIESWLKTMFFKLHFNVIGAIYLVKENVIRPRRLPNYEKQEYRTIVITGGGRGIGEEAVKKFLKLNIRVIIGCRSPENVQKKFDELIAGDKETYTGSVTCFYLDLMKLESVKSFAGSVLNMDTCVSVLINNAGIMFGPRKETEDGFESQLATNYLGHFHLTHLLLPALAKSAADNNTGGCKIVNVSSCAHYTGSWLDWNDLHMKNYYSSDQAYANSKAAQIVFTKHLGKMLDTQGHDIKVCSIHPGVVFTELLDDLWWVKMLTPLAKLLTKTPEQGGDTIVHAALDTWNQSSHLENHRETRVSTWCQNMDHQNKMWSVTCTMLGIDTFGQ